MKSFALIALAITAVLAAPRSLEPLNPAFTEIKSLFQKAQNNGFVAPDTCPLAKSLPPFYDCKLTQEPAYMNWLEMKGLSKSLQKQFAGRLTIRSWDAEGEVTAWTETGDAEYWTVEFGDGCERQVGTLPMGDFCMRATVRNAFE